MARPGSSSLLYRLIEAGQLTRRALAQPLIERGLEPGDDALLFLLERASGATENDVADALGMSEQALAQRVARLIGQNLLYRRTEPGGVPRLALTPPGEHFVRILTTHWRAIEDTMLAEVSTKRRRKLKRLLASFIDTIG